MITAEFELYRILCLNDGEVGEGEPYLWTLFFRIDKSVIQQREDDPFFLAGAPQFHSGKGSHGNLGAAGMTPPDARAIAPDVGRFVVTDLTTLDLENPIDHMAIPAPGIIGVVAVLMEENGVSDHGAEAGHAAFDAFARVRISEFISTLNLLNVKIAADAITAADPSKSPADALVEALGQMVSDFATTLREEAAAVLKSAITDDQNVLENLGSLFDPDSLIDVKVLLATTSDLARHGNKVELESTFREDLSGPAGGGGLHLGARRYRIYGRMTGTAHTVPVVSGTVPEGDHVRISCVRKAHSKDLNVWFISQVGGMDHGKPWLLAKGKVIQLIQEGSKTFFVRAPDGTETPVIVAFLADGRPYLTTPATNFAEDNLSALPPCPTAVDVDA